MPDPLGGPTTVRCHDWTWCRSACRTNDTTLDGWVEGGIGSDGVCQHLVHDILRWTACMYDWLTISTGRHEVVLGDGVGGGSRQVASGAHPCKDGVKRREWKSLSPYLAIAWSSI